MREQPQAVNVYERLEQRGWERISGNTRMDFYRKGGWIVAVPMDIRFPIRAYRAQPIIIGEEREE